MTDKIAQLEKNMAFISTMKGRLIITSVISASSSFGVALAGYKGIFLHILFFIFYYLLVTYAGPPYLKYLHKQAENAASKRK
jgi:predicted Na+-dependent transporter